MDKIYYQRTRKDACLIRQVNLPAAGGTVFSDVLYLGPSPLGLLAREFDVEIAVDAAPALVDGKHATCTLQDSADGVNFAPVPNATPCVVTGDNGDGSDAFAVQFPVAPSLRNYLRLASTVDAGGGDNTAVNVTLSLVF